MMATGNLAAMNGERSRRRVYHRLRMARDYLTSYYRARSGLRAFAQIETYCMFIGHARSGHSIIGALLDAHPNAILADEADALAYLAAGFRREQIFQVLLTRSQRQAATGRIKAGRGGKTYSYHVPNQWQGSFSTLKVIGDSRAGKSTQRLASDPQTLDRLRHCMAGTDLRLIHVVRNPFDNISTMILRGGRSFENAIEQYVANCYALVSIRARLSLHELLTIRQEQFIQQPKPQLQMLCRFLKIEPTDDYLDACADIVYTSAAKSRYGVPWNNALITRVQQQIDQFDFLSGYSYDE